MWVSIENKQNNIIQTACAYFAYTDSARAIVRHLAGRELGVE